MEATSAVPSHHRWSKRTAGQVLAFGRRCLMGYCDECDGTAQVWEAGKPEGAKCVCACPCHDDQEPTPPTAA